MVNSINDFYFGQRFMVAGKIVTISYRYDQKNSLYYVVVFDHKTVEFGDLPSLFAYLNKKEAEPILKTA